MARLHERYDSEIKGKLQEKFNYNNVMEIPRLVKVVVNTGLGEAIAKDVYKRQPKMRVDAIPHSSTAIVHSSTSEQPM